MPRHARSILTPLLAVLLLSLPSSQARAADADDIQAFLSARPELAQLAQKAITPAGPGVWQVGLGQGSNLSLYVFKAAPGGWTAALVAKDPGRFQLGKLLPAQLIGNVQASRAFLLVGGAAGSIDGSTLAASGLKTALDGAGTVKWVAGANLYAQLSLGSDGALGLLSGAGVLPAGPVWLQGSIGRGLVDSELGEGGDGPASASTDLGMTLTLSVPSFVPAPFTAFASPKLTLGASTYTLSRTGGVTTLSGEQKNSTVRLGSKTVTMPSTRLTFTAGGDGQYTVAVEGWGDANWSDAFGLSGLTITQLGLTGTLTKAPKADGRKSVAGFGLDLQAKLSLSGAAYTATLSADLDGSKLSDLSLSLSGDLSLGFTGIAQLSSIKLTNAVVGVRPADAQGYFAGSMSWKGMTGTAAVVMGKGTAAAFLQATELDLGALVNQKKLLASLPKLSGVLMVGKSAAGNKPIRDLPAPVSKMLGDVYGDTSEKVTFAAGVSFFTKVDAASLGFTQANVPGPLVLSGALDLEKSTFDLSASLGAFPAIPNTPQGFAIESPRFLLGVSKADTGFEFDLGLGITMRANVGGQDLAVTTKVRADSTGSLKFTGTLDTDWVAPLGLSSLTLKAPVGVSFSVNADASVDLGFQAGARIDDKEFNPVGLCLNIQAAAPVPVPKKIAVHFKASELTPLTEVQLAASLLKSAANGPLKDGIPDKNFRAALKKIDTQSNQLEHMADGLPMPKLTGAEFYLATPGIKCDLPAFDGMGAQITGSLSFMDHDLGGLDSKLNLTDGLKIKGDIKPFKLLDLVSLTQARIDVLAPMPTAGAALFDAHFYLDGNANVLLASGQIHVTLDKKKASFDLESALADLGSTKMFATSIGDDLLHATDFKLGLRAQTDVEGAMLKKLGDGLKATAAARKAAKQAEQKQHEKDLADTQKAFDKLDADVGKRFRKADGDVKDAEKDVDRAQKKLDDAKADCKKKLGGASFLCDTVDAAKKSVDAYEDTLEAARKVLKGIKESTSYANWAAKKTALATLQAEHDAFTDTMNVWSDLDAAAQKLSSGLASDVFTLRKLTFDGSVASASGTLSLDVVVGQADLYETYTLDLKKAVPLDVSKLAGRIADEFANLTKKKGSGGGSSGGSGSGNSGGGSATSGSGSGNSGNSGNGNSGTTGTTKPATLGPAALPAGYVASKKSDTALSAGFIIDGKAWFFRGTKCFRFDAATSKLDAGFPQDTASAWPGVFDGRIDAAVRAGDNIYFFNGNSYAKWDVPTNRLINIKRIQHNWTFLFEETGVDAGMSYGGKLWFFEGNGIASWDLAADKIDEHFPAATSNVFPGLPDAFKSVDAAFVWPDGNVYFVRGSQAVSYDAGTKKKNGAPFALGSKWKGL